MARDYVLPDFTSLRRGFMKGREESVGRPTAEGEQIIRMNNERFAVPELLFNPSDIGIEQEREVPISEMLGSQRKRDTFSHKQCRTDLMLITSAGGNPGDHRERGGRVPRAGAAVALQEHRPRGRLLEDPQLQGEGRAGGQGTGPGRFQGEWMRQL